MNVKVSIDAMGGDFGPSVTMEAVIRVLSIHLDVSALVFGDLSVLQNCIDINLNSCITSRLEICHC